MINNRSIYKIVLFVLVLLAPGIRWLKAQGELRVEDVRVIKDFEAMLKDFRKIRLEPVMPQYDISSRHFEYLISSKPLRLTYEKPSIRPLALPDEILPKKKEGMFRIAYGLPNAFLADLSYGRVRGDSRLATAIRHRSAHNKSIEKQQFMTNGLDLDYANTFGNDLQLNAQGFFNVDYYNLFGLQAQVDSAILNPVENRRLLHWDTRISLDKSHLTPILDGSLYIAHRFMHNNAEVIRDQEVSLGGSLSIDGGNNILIDIPTGITLGLSSIDTSQAIYHIRPVLSYHRPFISLIIGAHAGYGKEFFIYPEAKISINKIFRYFDLFAGVTQDVKINSSYGRGMENPFMHFNSGRLENTYSRDHYAGFRANVEGAKFELSANYRQFRQVHFFIPSFLQPARFDVIFDDGHDIALKAMLNYEITEQITLTGEIEKHFYRMDNELKAWHRPGLEALFNGRFTLFDEKLKINAGLIFESELYYPSGLVAEKLPVIFDVSGKIEYCFTQGFSLFAEWNNITASKYYYWYRYPSYRIHLVGGFKFLF